MEENTICGTNGFEAWIERLKDWLME